MTLTRLDLVTGSYGPGWRTGVLVDALGSPKARGLVVREAPSGALWIHDPATSEPARPVVCGEIVRIYTEDGPIDGRCGVQIRGDAGACEAHATQIEAWAAQTESETIAWERELESV